MEKYCVNKNSQSNGDHEVHRVAKCNHLPNYENQIDLGYHSNSRSALSKAKEHYTQSNGCKYCCEEIHTK